jgi:hypothetical protein
MIPINKVYNYSLPIKIITEDLNVNHTNKLPVFAIFIFPTYNFSPKTGEDLGIFEIKGKLYNKYGSLDFSFIVDVTIPVPTLSNSAPIDLNVEVGGES